VITLDAEGRILGADARATALFGAGADDLAGHEFGALFAPGVEGAARDYFDRVRRGNNVLDNVLEVEARAGDRRAPLAMTLSRIGTNRFCAVFRDATARKQTEDALRDAKRETQRAAAAKAEFLAKVSHEIRTPLNAMTGFAEVIMAERFGPIGNERYREYVRDIHAAGTHIVAMLNDLLDLSKAETGQIDLNFANVNLNELTQQCVAIMQGQANRARIIIRTSLTPNLPRVLADERSLRQIVLNLLSNSIRFTGPGGQVIVSTVYSDAREGVLRVRDTGAGMSEKDIQAALEPFNETATSGSFGSGGTGFGLSLTKALAEANRAHFNLKSAPNAGTLVEVAFPPSRVVAD
jgi:PAS domain S-box-containing protein